MPVILNLELVGNKGKKGVGRMMSASPGESYNFI